MKWRRSNRRKTATSTRPEVTIAKGAAREAEQRLRATQDQWATVNRVVSNLVTMREKNHFAERIRSAVLGGE
jgi:hypothetical protein